MKLEDISDTDLRVMLSEATRIAKITVANHSVINELRGRGYEVSFYAQAVVTKKKKGRCKCSTTDTQAV